MYLYWCYRAACSDDIFKPYNAKSTIKKKKIGNNYLWTKRFFDLSQYYNSDRNEKSISHLSILYFQNFYINTEPYTPNWPHLLTLNKFSLFDVQSLIKKYNPKLISKQSLPLFPLFSIIQERVISSEIQYEIEWKALLVFHRVSHSKY